MSLLIVAYLFQRINQIQSSQMIRKGVYAMSSACGNVSPRFLTEADAMEYLRMSRSMTRRFGEKIGAVRRIGRSVRYDRVLIDATLEANNQISIR